MPCSDKNAPVPLYQCTSMELLEMTRCQVRYDPRPNSRGNDCPRDNQRHARRALTPPYSPTPFAHLFSAGLLEDVPYTARRPQRQPSRTVSRDSRPALPVHAHEASGHSGGSDKVHLSASAPDILFASGYAYTTPTGRRRLFAVITYERILPNPRLPCLDSGSHRIPRISILHNIGIPNIRSLSGRVVAFPPPRLPRCYPGVRSPPRSAFQETSQGHVLPPPPISLHPPPARSPPRVVSAMKRAVRSATAKLSQG
ncbi:hypothetical protein HYPSUDRAFT_204909 [Hypholoma sublateritium FD-334 SS-4]|uniref:Uncharacterized protein n=1 Tax=Hypholoma sublateritium (strain FD-334 SS-4) TaxID=945553 RepID=A0A0D2KWI2_HYPSF|nr:hypothetical protein HYPSUDRAFT_204909 [Hypholoma sublateritium FD-334 SS-4]